MEQEQFSVTQFKLSDDRRTVTFDYVLFHDGRELHVSERLVFPLPLADTPQQQRSLRALHLALGISYYKIFLPPVIAQPYAMDNSEAAFWNDVWQHGLGEFLYVNKLSAGRLATFIAQDGMRYEGATAQAGQGALLGIGGGKDSIVAGELLKGVDVPVTGFVMATGEQLGQTEAVAKVMGVELLAVKRTIDAQLLELQEQPGASKGHIPISLIFGLVGTALAIARGARFVVVANEASASIPRVIWNEQAVNHQWSKSFGFETQLQQFIHESINANTTYFSAIRQLTSIGVAKLFSDLPAYFEVFTSDNFVFRIDPARRPSGRWSLESPKSLSSYLLLAPWVSDEDMRRIFTIDFLDEPSLDHLFLALTGIEGDPPLDCVGTVDELLLSVNLLAHTSRYADTALMRLAVERAIVREGDWTEECREQLLLQSEQALPAELHDRIATYLRGRLQA